MGVPLTSATSIKGLSWLGVDEISSFPSFTINQAQPLPNLVAPAVLNFSWNASKEPNVELIAPAKLPEGLPPAFAERMFQKNEWFQWPPPLLRTAGEILPAFAMSCSKLLFSCSVPA